ncbi:alpha/beta fold hydrolase [Clostridium sp. UBA4548]|uniref:alpha/beta fold hydrolase n=1 Tax=Clostridium sp. UBA4548 TaxID=1946361 RepID=UPI0025C21EAB|nr:alpha/beta hydrolase [Clostridium sp. UBA4548]
MKVLRKAKKILLISLLVLMIIITIIYVYNKIQLKREAKLFKPLGEIVEVNGHKISIYTEGHGEKTLVFMSGGGTSSPILDFKSLFSQLSDDYRIVVIEKLGYGFSDVVDEKRDIDTILNQSRAALTQAGIEGPFILCPHSMSGIEALYWAQKYPEEVSAIIGLDMAVPETYENYKLNMPLAKAAAFANNIGITRILPGIAESEAIKYGTLSNSEKDIYRAVFFRRTTTKTMLNELEEIKNNAKIVDNSKLPKVPILMFSSNGTGTGWSEKQWTQFQENFINKISGGKIIYLNCSHYVHDHEYLNIAREIKAYIS